MRRTLVLIALTAATLATGAAHAQPARSALDCDKVSQRGGTQSELNSCQGQEFASADADLNKVYGQLRQHFKETSDTEASALLVKAQRAWVGWRDSEGELCAQTQGWSQAGSGYGAVVRKCTTELTRKRTGELRMHLREAESH